MDDIFQTVQEELDMEFFLSRESVPYKLTRGVNGMQMQVRTCPNPACNDNRWRTYFGVETGRGNCFICGTNYSKATFIHNYYEHTHWRDTIAKMREILLEQGWRPVRKVSVAVMDTELVLPLNTPIPLPGGVNLPYLEQRGITADIAAYFRLAWCDMGWWKFTGEDGRTAMQDFSKRVIIPVHDLDGELKTFQGRDVLGFSDRKYLFPKQLPGTGRYLLNGINAIFTDHVAMGEGFFDVAAMKIAFDGDSELRSVVPVGSFGKHLSYGSQDGNDQLGRFHQLKTGGVKRVTIMWDGEPAALVAALDAGKLLSRAGFLARIALLPKGKDPNEVPAEVVRKAFREAEVWTPAIDVTWRLRNPYR